MAGQARNLCGVRMSHLLLLATPALSATDAGELPEGQARAIIPVSGMTCGDCRVKVEAAVVKIGGVVEVKEATHTPPCEPSQGAAPSSMSPLVCEIAYLSWGR
jgi:hypothetical protein